MLIYCFINVLGSTTLCFWFQQIVEDSHVRTVELVLDQSDVAVTFFIMATAVNSKSVSYLNKS